MKYLIEKFWNEPAVAISVLTALGNALGIIIVSAADHHLNGAAWALAFASLGLTGAGGAVIRSQVVPKNKGRKRGTPSPTVTITPTPVGHS
jgi:hypothetical protein